jgi:Na+/melibiose symporter-like transporter
VGEQIKISGFDLFVFFYFQQVLGLSGSLAGAAMAIALAFDAVTDPLLGSLSDNWQSPRGRRHPFMYAAALPLAVFWFGLFFPPAGLGQVGLFVWLTTFAILIRGSMTLYHVPHMAMGAELSEDYEERTSVVSWRITFGLLGGVLTSAVALALFFPETAQYKNGLLNPSGYPKLALFGAALMALTIWYSAWGTRDQIPRLPKAPKNTAKASFGSVLRGSWAGYAEAFKLRSFRAVFGGAASLAIAYGISTTLLTHINVFFWEFSGQQQAALRIAGLPGFVLAIVFARWAHRRFDKRPIAIVGGLGIPIAYNAPVILRFLGVAPENGSPLLLLLAAVCLAGVGLCAGLNAISASSMMADVAQELEYRSGKAQQGVLFSAIALAQKLGSAGGHIVAGVGIDLIAFPVKAKDPSSISPILIEHLGLLFLSAAVVAFVGAFAYTRYNLDRSSHTESLRVLAERRRAMGD